MKICVVQARSAKGDIGQNIINHKKLIELAVSKKAGIIIFPELSITGYEPSLAKELAANKDDKRLDVFQSLSDTNQVTIGVGMPTKSGTGTSISMIIFQPGKTSELYSKKYLHADEDSFFISGENFRGLKTEPDNIALAICYELSVPAHSEDAYKAGASIYLTSVAKTPSGVQKAAVSLATIAANYSMTVLMANCVGQCDGEACGGKSAIWNNKGVLMGQLDDTNEGILIIDTETQEIIKESI